MKNGHCTVNMNRRCRIIMGENLISAVGHYMNMIGKGNKGREWCTEGERSVVVGFCIYFFFASLSHDLSPCKVLFPQYTRALGENILAEKKCFPDFARFSTKFLHLVLYTPGLLTWTFRHLMFASVKNMAFVVCVYYFIRGKVLEAATDIFSCAPFRLVSFEKSLICSWWTDNNSFRFLLSHGVGFSPCEVERLPVVHIDMRRKYNSSHYFLKSLEIFYCMDVPRY